MISARTDYLPSVRSVKDRTMRSNSNAVFLCQRCKATAQLVKVNSGREMIRCPVCSHAEVARKLYAAVERAVAELMGKRMRMS